MFYVIYPADRCRVILRECDTEPDVCRFVTSMFTHGTVTDISDFKVFEGTEVKLTLETKTIVKLQ